VKLHTDNDHIFNQICEKIVGRIAITEAETRLLVEVATKGSEGHHFEVGCLWGATAIAVALANPRLNIITVDIMEGEYWAEGDPSVAMMTPTPEIVLANFVLFEVADRITAIKAKSYPWPLILPQRCFSFFIDGDHSYLAVLRDWETAKAVTDKYILFHDYQSPLGWYKGIEVVIDYVVLKDIDWRVYEQAETLIAFERVNEYR